MKKQFKYTDMHPTARCKYCNKPIKTRLAIIKSRVPEECYMHFALRRCRETGRKMPERLMVLARKRGEQHV